MCCTLPVSSLFFWRKKKKPSYECHLFIPSEVKKKLFQIWNFNLFTVSMKWHGFFFSAVSYLKFPKNFYITKKCAQTYTCLYVLFSRCARGTRSTYFTTVDQNNLQTGLFFNWILLTKRLFTTPSMYLFTFLWLTPDITQI